MEATIVIVALIAYVGFHQWLRQQRRMIVHRERLTAMEKGTELPAVEQEVQQSGRNVQRILLLAGLSWISVGVGAIIVLSAVIDHGAAIPLGLQWIGIAPIGIGLSHLIVYAVENRRTR